MCFLKFVLLGMEENSLNQLKQSIGRLRKDREQMVMELARDRSRLEHTKAQADRMQSNYDNAMVSVNDRRELVGNYEKMIDESESAYTKLMNNTNKLIATLDIESQGIRQRVAPQGRNNNY